MPLHANVQLNQSARAIIRGVLWKNYSFSSEREGWEPAATDYIIHHLSLHLNSTSMR